MIAAVLTPVALNLGSALFQSSRPTGARCSLDMSDLGSGLNPSSPTDRAAVAARAAAARYPTQPVYGAPGSGGALTDAEAKLKWAADRNAQQRIAQRSQSPPPPSDETVRLAKATEHLRRGYSASIGAGTIYSPPGSGGGMTDAEAKQVWSAQRSASERAAARQMAAAGQMAAAAPTTAAPDADEATRADEPAAAEPAAAEPAAPAAAAPANTASYPQAAAPANTASTSLAASARARPSLYPTQSIYAPPGAGGAMTDAEAKRKWSTQRNAEQRRAERAEREARRPTTQ